MIKKILKSPVALVLLVTMAVVLVVFQVRNKAELTHSGNSQLPPLSVEYIALARVPFQARATAYGHVEPVRVLHARTEVSGKVSYIHPDLKQGATLLEDTVALRIEATTFEISLAQNQASLQASESSLEQLLVEKKNTASLLDIAQKNLQVGQAELERISKIYERNLVAKSSVDAEEQKVLSLQQQLQEVEGQMAAYDSREAELRAQIERSASVVEQSQDTLGRTEIRVPFDARIGAVAVEEGEFVASGAELFEALGMEAVEISAELPMSQFRPLIINFPEPMADDLAATRAADAVSRLNIDSTVKLVGDFEDSATWTGELKRIGESVDPTRSTMNLVVSVDKPYDNIVPGKRPPLVKGMFTAVELAAEESHSLVIPRSALHQGRVYTVGENNELQIKAVNLGYLQGEYAVLEAEQPHVTEGERVIVSDVIPVIPGMPLLPIEVPLSGEQL